MGDAKDLLKQMEKLRNNGAFLPTEAPKKIYCDHDCMGNIIRAHNTKWSDDEFENIEYIRKDVVEHIIYSSLGPKEILNKLRSL